MPRPSRKNQVTTLSTTLHHQTSASSNCNPSIALLNIATALSHRTVAATCLNELIEVAIGLKMRWKGWYTNGRESTEHSTAWYKDVKEAVARHTGQQDLTTGETAEITQSHKP